MSFGGFSTTTKPAFGATQSTPAFGGGNTFGSGGSIFGQPAQQQNQQQQTAFGQQPQTQGTSLFGQPQNQNQQQQQQPTTGLFGQTQPVASTSIFGQPAQQNTNTAGTTSIFGQPAQNQGATTSIFGQPAQNTGTTTNIFGQQNQQNQQQQQQQQGSLFGANQGQNTPAPSLFGGTTNQAQTNTTQTQPGLFGGFGATNAQQPTGTTTFGASTTTGGLFGSKPQQQTMPNQVLFTKSTKFNDLPDELKKMLENIDSHIQGRIQISKELKQRKLGEEASKGQELINETHQVYASSSATVHSDLLLTKDMRAKVDQAVQDTIIATRIIDGFRQPQQNGAYLKNHANFPFEFFSRITQQMKERLQWYRVTIEQIERKLSTTANQGQHTPQAISASLQAQNAIFVALAGKTATLHADLEKIKALYTQLWRARTDSMRDPFEELDRASGDEFGLSSLNV